MTRLRFLLLVFCSIISISLYSQTNHKDSLLIKRYKLHISSLDYISRKTDNNRHFLNLQNSYVDSIRKIDPSNSFATISKNRISLINSTCKDNINHKMELFDFFAGIPEYMGFADNPIEYAYDESINNLLSVPSLSVELDENNLTKSILIRDSCDDEMHEIIYQLLTKNAKHSILSIYEVENLIGESEARKLVNGNSDETILSLLCKKLDIDRIGIFKVNNIDLINNSICLVGSSFQSYSINDGFSNLISKKGFSIDKRNISFLHILIHIFESILLISIFSFIDQRKKLWKIYKDKTISTSRSYLELFFEKIKFISTCFVIPFVMSLVMIKSISIIMPDSVDHFMESSSIFWLISLTISMSIIPTLLNLLFINGLDMDGFHSIKGYSYFFNTSLYASYFPIFIFFTIQFGYIPRINHIVLIIVTAVVSRLLARSYYQFTSSSIHKNIKFQSVFGLILSITSLVFFNTIILAEINIINLLFGFLVVTPINFLHFFIGQKLKVINEKKITDSQKVTLIKDVFLNSVIDPKTKIFKNISNSISPNKLDIRILSAPMGIGKTSSLKEAKEHFKEWEWFYGDCDEVQGEEAVAFEPFIEAFSDLMGIRSKFTSRSQIVEAQKSLVTSLTNVVGINTDFIEEFQRKKESPMTETCIDIIDKLESLDKKIVFVMEDLHWIDPESYSFLLHFIKIANNNKFLRGNLFIVLTLREGLNTEYRGINHEKLSEDLNAISNKKNNEIIISNLLNSSDFNMYDFVKNLSNQNNKFKIQSYSMNQINSIFNNEISANNDLTPLYIIKVLEGWINDTTLKYSPDGYHLTKSIDNDSLPNADQVDSYYHSVFDSFDPKWQRLIESAAIIGNKFDAEILAKVWGHDFLDILAFLENAVKLNLLIDIPGEDNFYEFKDKRIISALKSYFSVPKDDLSEKQIVIEYNKRYVETQKQIIKNSHLSSIPELLKVTRRIISLSSNYKYYKDLQKLTLELIIRYLVKQDYNSLEAFSQIFTNTKDLKILSYIISSMAVTSNEDLLEKDREAKYNEVFLKCDFFEMGDFNFDLLIILKLYYDKIILNEDELNYIIKKSKEDYSELTSLHITIKISNVKKDFKFGFDLKESFLARHKNSKNYDSYDLIIKENFLWSHALNNLIKDKSSSPYFDTWPINIKKIDNDKILFECQSLLKSSKDPIVNESLIALMLMIYSNLNMDDDTIKLFSELNDYIPEKPHNLRLLVGLKIRLIANSAFKNLSDQMKDNLFVFIDNYINKRFGENHFNKTIELYINNKLNYFKGSMNKIDFKKILDSYSHRIKVSFDDINRSHLKLYNQYSNYYNLISDNDNALKWFDKQIKTYSLIIKDDKVKPYNKQDRLKNYLLKKQFIFRSLNNSTYLGKAKKYALEIVNKKNIDFPDYGDTFVLCAFVYEKRGEYNSSVKYFDLAISYFQSSTHDEKDWRVAYYSLRSALNLAEIELKSAIPKLKQSLKSVLLYKFKDKRTGKEHYIRKAEKFIE